MVNDDSMELAVLMAARFLILQKRRERASQSEKCGRFVKAVLSCHVQYFDE